MRFLTVSLLLAASYVNGMADEPPKKFLGWGDVVDPEGDSLVQRNEDQLLIEFGEGRRGLDAEHDRMNAPRVLQGVKGDFSIQVTVDGELPLPKPDEVQGSAYISGGILILQDDNNYIRFERASFTRSGRIWHYANFEQRIDAVRTRMGRFADFPLQNDKAVEMRLEVKGPKVRALVRHVGDDWHELGIARMKDRDEVLVGVSGVKTDEPKAKVSFRNLDLNLNLIAAEAKSESEIDLNEIRQILLIPKPENVQWRDLIRQMEQLQKRATEVGQLSEMEQTKLINEAKRLGTRTTPKQKAYLGPSIARRLAGAF